MPYLGLGPSDPAISSANTGSDQKFVYKHSATESFTANFMGIKVHANNSSSEFLVGVIYADDSGSPGALLAYTANFVGDDTTHWDQLSLSSSVSISSGNDYWIGVHFPVGSYYMYNASVLNGAYNDDTFSDGAADPFGSSNSTSEEVAAFVSSSSLFITGNGDLSNGAATVEAGGGTKLAVFLNNSGDIEIYSDIDSAPTLEDSDTPTTIHGGGAVGWIHAAIDSSDNIHLISACSTEQTRDVSYAIATESGGSWTIGAWEEAANYTEQAPSNPGVSISIDGSDKPHILFVDAVKQTGATTDNVYYTEKTGASWAAATKIGDRGTKTDEYNSPKITLRNSDYIEAIYNFVTDIDLAYKAEIGGGWPSESVYSEGTAVIPGGVTATTGGTPYRNYVADADEDIEENDVDTGYDTHGTYSRVSPVLVDNSGRYIFYIDTSDDVHLISNDGGGWVDEGALQVGTYEYVIAEWAYNNENQIDEINYIFEESGTIYYDSFDLGGAAVRVPRHGFTNFQIPGIV